MVLGCPDFKSENPQARLFSPRPPRGWRDPILNYENMKQGEFPAEVELHALEPVAYVFGTEFRFFRREGSVQELIRLWEFLMES
jgi:hypothetical protein